MRMPTRFEVRAEWADEAGVWMATSEAVPGLCVQADTLDELIATATPKPPLKGRYHWFAEAQNRCRDSITNST